LNDRGWLGLHTSIWKVASTHVVVDAYTNIYAPMLPLLIPRLNLSLAEAGTLAMCFQLANSVSQLAFGALADRWRPRALVLVGPLVAVIVLSMIGLAHSPWTLGAILVLGGLGGAAFHPPAAALVYKLAEPGRKGTAMSAHLSGGSLGFSLAPVQCLHGPRLHPVDHDSGIARAVVDAAAGSRHDASGEARAIEPGDASPGGGAVDAAVLHDRLADRHDLRLHDVYADAADAAGLVDR
jgi:Major Facilitator Superfamily